MRMVWAIAAAAATLGYASTSRGVDMWCNPCQMPCTPCEPAARATFDPSPGTFPAPQQVKVSTRTPGAVIHYTTDGTEPTENSPVYRGAIAVDSTTTLRAMAQVPGLPRSGISTGAYTIAPPVAVVPKKLNVAEKVHFETGRSALEPGSAAILDGVAQTLQERPDVKHVVIEGHTDAKGGQAVNEKLSKDRAEAVRQYLIGQGIEPDRLESQGFGPSRPIADNDTPEGREANRRVEFVVVTPEPGHPGEMGTGSGPSQ